MYYASRRNRSPTKLAIQLSHACCISLDSVIFYGGDPLPYAKYCINIICLRGRCAKTYGYYVTIIKGIKHCIIIGTKFSLFTTSVYLHTLAIRLYIDFSMAIFNPLIETGAWPLCLYFCSH